MKYVAKHLTRHHLFHAPHRWFFALLLSPIHAAELHYQKRYHLQFAHARKLFLFDLFLVAMIFGLAGLTAYWFWYDPTITEKITITVTPYRHDTPGVVAERIQSGEHVTFVIAYHNTSDQNITNATLRLHTPDYYAIETALPANQFATSTLTFALGSIPRGGQGTVEVSGMLYNEPDREDHFIAELNYQPSERLQSETRLGSVFLYMRGSVLQANLELPERLPATSVTMATLTLHNSYHHALPRISVPFPTGTVNVKPLKTKAGTTTAAEWQLPGLDPGETVSLPLTVQTNIKTDTTGSLQITPFIFPNLVGVPQTRLQKTWTVARPNVTITGVWENTAAAPGSNQKLTVLIRNRGTEIVQNISIAIPLPTNSVDSARWISAGNVGRVNNGVATITHAHDVRLTELVPDAEISVPIIIPIKNFPTGAADAKINLPLRLHAQVAGLTSEFDTQTNAPELQLGTALRVSGEARYYTADGDQLGRGPLPPQVGKETKYALLLRVTNATAQADNVRLSATLPSGLNWTGKTSVSRGQEINYDPSTRRLTWSALRFPALTELSVFIEVGFTPSDSDRNRTVPLLQNIIVEGTDTVLNSPLRATAPALSSALSTDTLAKKIGTAVR